MRNGDDCFRPFFKRLSDQIGDTVFRYDVAGMCASHTNYRTRIELRNNPVEASFKIGMTTPSMNHICNIFSFKKVHIWYLMYYIFQLKRHNKLHNEISIFLSFQTSIPERIEVIYIF